jgi:hypothetical protein
MTIQARMCGRAMMRSLSVPSIVAALPPRAPITAAPNPFDRLCSAANRDEKLSNAKIFNLALTPRCADVCPFEIAIRHAPTAIRVIPIAVPALPVEFPIKNPVALGVLGFASREGYSHQHGAH